MKLLTLLMLALCCGSALADCPTSVPLKGLVTLNHCDAASGKCVRGDKALYDYMDAVPDAGPATLSISAHGSPWHVFDDNYRIIEIDKLAATVRQQGSNIKQVKLVASWSGVAPDSHSSSVAARLSRALGGMPVTGQDGFVWVSQRGALRTTHQAFTARVGGPYWIGQGDDVMASLVPGWAIAMEPEFIKSGDAAGLMRVGAGKEIFMLCPDGALASFDASAALNNPVAAFNAAIIRLERGRSGDVRAAMLLLKQAAAQGDQQAADKLQALAKSRQH